MTEGRPDIKLIALDMDGTLLNDNQEISEANQKAIKAAEEKGIYVVIATGRSLKTVGSYVKDLGLSSYLVTINGGEIWDGVGSLVERNSLDLKWVEMMWDLTNSHGSRFWAINTETVHRGSMPENLGEHTWIKYGFDFDDQKTRAEVLDKLKTYDALELSNSSPLNIEVNARGVNKARGLEKVCGFLGLSLEHVMGCGDSLNDLQMIKEVGWGVAMGNAQDPVKEAADWISSTNNEDGVARAIEKWVL